MKKSRFFSALIFVVLSFILVPAAAKAALWEVPTGLKPGDTFRWVFVTSQSTTASYSDIEYYNTFINKLFDGPYNPEVSGLMGKDSLGDIDWKAIASGDPGVYALDNIGLTTSGIYNPTGTLVANGTTNMLYGGYHTLAAPIMINELGESCECAVWTGTPPHKRVGSCGRKRDHGRWYGDFWTFFQPQRLVLLGRHRTNE